MANPSPPHPDAHWQNIPVTVLGLSKSGIAVARYLQTRGAQCFISETLPASDSNAKAREELQGLGVEIEMGAHTAKCFNHSELVVTSPGIPPKGSIIEQLVMSQKEIISEVELAYREAQKQTPTLPIIGITGTNGKSTTTTLISEILKAGGLNAPACGNIGLPLLDIMNEHQALDFLVAELSSFQLQFSPTLKAKIAVFTNFRPDHLDWHGGLASYRDAKLKLFTGKQAPEWVVLNCADPLSETILQTTSAKVFGYSIDPKQVATLPNKAFINPDNQTLTLCPEGGSPIELFNTAELKIIGDHNIENVLASVITAYLAGVAPEKIKQACLQFAGLEHRLERITLPENSALSQIAFYNDSKATNPDSAISALKAFKPTEPVILIAGGYDKKTPLDEMIAEIKTHTKAVVLLGNAKERFAEALQASGYQAIEISPQTDGIKDALERAIRLSLAENPTQPAPILFSPACASFDMFKNYEERGKVFKELVQEQASPKVTAGGAV